MSDSSSFEPVVVEWDGEGERPEIGTGLFEMPDEQFPRFPGTAQSRVKRVLKSPYHEWHYKHHPELYRRDQKHFAFGRYLHDLLLQPGKALGEWWIKPEGFEARSKVNKEILAAKQDVFGHNILSFHDAEAANRMVENARRKTTLNNLLSDGWSEVSMFWRDEETGLPCKGKMDYMKFVSSDVVAISDPKTTADASLDGFNKAMGNFEYHLQAAFYMDGLLRCLPWLKGVLWYNIPMEKEPPYEVGFYDIKQRDIVIGRDQYRRALHTYKDCLERDEWPGYEDGLQTAELPIYYKRKNGYE